MRSRRAKEAKKRRRELQTKRRGQTAKGERAVAAEEETAAGLGSDVLEDLLRLFEVVIEQCELCGCE